MHNMNNKTWLQRFHFHWPSQYHNQSRNNLIQKWLKSICSLISSYHNLIGTINFLIAIWFKKANLDLYDKKNRCKKSFCLIVKREFIFIFPSCPLPPTFLLATLSFDHFWYCPYKQTRTTLCFGETEIFLQGMFLIFFLG